MVATLGQLIRERRLELNLTQEQLAERVGDGVRQSEISRLERNRITLPRRHRMEDLAAALDIPLGVLLARSGWAGAEAIEDDPASESIEDPAPAPNPVESPVPAARAAHGSAPDDRRSAPGRPAALPENDSPQMQTAMERAEKLRGEYESIRANAETTMHQARESVKRRRANAD